MSSGYIISTRDLYVTILKDWKNICWLQVPEKEDCITTGSIETAES